MFVGAFDIDPTIPTRSTSASAIRSTAAPPAARLKSTDGGGTWTLLTARLTGTYPASAGSRAESAVTIRDIGIDKSDSNSSSSRPTSDCSADRRRRALHAQCRCPIRRARSRSSSTSGPSPTSGRRRTVGVGGQRRRCLRDGPGAARLRPRRAPRGDAAHVQRGLRRRHARRYLALPTGGPGRRCVRPTSYRRRRASAKTTRAWRSPPAALPTAPTRPKCTCRLPTSTTSHPSRSSSPSSNRSTAARASLPPRRPRPRSATRSAGRRRATT